MLRNTSPGGVAQERLVCQRMLKFINISTTPLRKAAALGVSSRQSEKHVADEAGGGGAIASEVLAKKES
jgi:hypothetical protein